jgi:NitT/TauT family transport system permease protein
VALVWEVVAFSVNRPMLPPASAVLETFVRLLLNGTLVHHAFTSLVNVLLGLLLAYGVGIGLGIGVSGSRFWDALVMPVVDAMRPVAALTLFPLIILWLGLGIESKVFVIFWTAWPAVLLNTVQALRSVDPTAREAAQLDGADSCQVLRYIALPLALPGIMTGLRIGASGGWISLVAAEMLGASAGLGYATLAYSQTFQFPQMYAVILTIAGLGLVINLLLAFVQEHFTWEESVYESHFIRYHDRALAWGLDGLFRRTYRELARRAVREL